MTGPPLDVLDSQGICGALSKFPSLLWVIKRLRRPLQTEKKKDK